MKGVKEKKPGSTVKKQGIFVFCLCIVIMFFLIIFLMVRFGRDTDQIFDKVIEDALVPSHTETVRVVNDKLKEHEGEIEEEKIFNGNTAKKENRVYHYICTREGKVLAGDVKYYSIGFTLRNELSRRRVPEKRIQEMEEELKSLIPGKPLYFSNLEGNGIYMAASALDYHDWVLVSVYQSSDMEKNRNTIIRNTRILATIPVICFILMVLLTMRYYLRQQKKIAKGQARYDILAGFSDTVLFEYDCMDKTLVFTPNITTQFNVKEVDMIRPFDKKQSLSIVYPEDESKVLNLLESVDEMQDGEVRDITIRLMDKDGNYRWVRWQARLSCGRLGRPQALLGKISDVHEEMTKEKVLMKRASVDALTGALNRASVETEIKAQLGEKGKKGFLFMVDVDDFKSVNDTWGHAAGDRVLACLVEELKKNFRRKDLIGRLGGDEFIIFMTDVDDVSVVRKKAEILLENLSHIDAPRFTISMGAAAYPKAGKTYEELYLAADKAMYQAKNNGKNSLYIDENSDC